MSALPASLPERPRGTVLRVVTYNVHSFAGADFRPTLVEMAARLRELQPDVVCLNEVERGVKAPGDGGGCALRYLGEAAGCPHVAFAEAEWKTFGNAVLSRHPMRAVTRVDLRTKRDRSRRIGRSMSWCELSTAGTPGLPPCLGVACMHLDYRSEELRKLQMREALRFLRTKDRLPHVVCGDLNALRREDYTDEEWGRIVRRRTERRWEAAAEGCVQLLDAGGRYEDLWTRTPPARRSRDMMTAHVDEPMYRIDYVFRSAALRLCAAAYRVDTECAASDHRLVLVDLAPRAGPAP